MKVLPLGAIDRLERNALRVAEIVGVLVKYGLADWLKKLPVTRIKEWLRSSDGEAIVDLRLKERVRMALTDLGTTFIKLGQMLSTRPDLVGLEMAEELSQLQAKAPADSPEKVRQLITNELGQPPETLLGYFDPEPFASASIAQVHHARLPTGESVVLKIQKSGVALRVEADLSILASLAELAEKHAAELRPYEPVALVRQFRRSIQRELDFHSERRNLEEFRRNFTDDPTVSFPRPWPQFCSRQVLTMDRFDGITGTDTGRLQASGADLTELARRGAAMYLEMIFRDSFYHADPHPGNLMLLPGGVLGVLDCGMTGRLDEGLRDAIEGVLLAIAQRDAESLTDAVWYLGAVPPDCSRDQLRSDLTDFVAEYTGQSITELDLSAALGSLTDIIRRYHIVLPPGVSLLLRTLVLLEGTSRRLSPEFSLAEVIQPYYQKSLGRRFSPQRMLLRLVRIYRDWDRLFHAFPRDLNELLRRVRTGRFSVHLDHRHLDPVVNRLVLGIMTASLFLGSSLLWSMNAPPLVGGVSIFGASGYLVALMLGWRLFRAVRKSGNVDSNE